MHRIVGVDVLDDYCVDLSFSDGARGVVDLSRLVGCGVFSAWKDYSEFRKVRVGETGDLVWPAGIDLCPDALYLKVTGKRPEDEFPALQQHDLAHA